METTTVTTLSPEKDPNHPPKQEAVVRIEHLSKSFGAKQVLKDINLRLIKGENLAILGKSGTGKSVLIKCIVGLVAPDSGTLLVFGKTLAGLNEHALYEIRKRIGFVFQNSALYDSMTVRENLEFPIRMQLRQKSIRETSGIIEEALEHVGLRSAIDEMPSELSGGMRKRVGLARTLILKPELILYDEPTTGLDPITSKEINGLILDVQRKYNTTSVIITHDIECTRTTANRILMLKEGVFVAEGTYEDLSKSGDSWVKSFFV